MKLDFHTLFQYSLPHHTLSRLAGIVCNCRQATFKNWLIDKFIRDYQVDMTSALEEDPHKYLTFNQFFTRELKPDARPIVQESDAIACPVDGSVSQIGTIQQGQLLQAKGHSYGLQELLGGSANLALTFQNGSFATLYLAPKDYHRIHMPLAGQLRQMIHVPGQLFSVSTKTAQCIPNLFARNERVIALFDTQAGPMAVILVGAMLVASIATQWAGIITPPSRKEVRTWEYKNSDVFLDRGAEMGHFQLGSTAIVLFGANKINWAKELQENSIVRMGQLLGNI